MPGHGCILIRTSTVTPVDIGTLIRRTPGVKGGRPCLADTGMSVQRVAVLYRSGMTVEAIHEEYPHITLDLMYAAITYYLANSEEIDGYLDDDARLYDELRAQMGPSPLVRKYLDR